MKKVAYLAVGALFLSMSFYFAKANDLVQSDDAISATSISRPRSIDEARSRAKLLFEMTNGSLQVMHRDFFDEENLHAIPSASLDEVFLEMRKTFNVEMKWINAGTDVVNTDHQPQGEFETRAAHSISRGKQFIEDTSAIEYQFAGAIRLRSQCLKCHVKDRTSTQDRFAGLVIKMQVDNRP